MLGTKVLLSFNVIQDLGAKEVDLSQKSVELVILIWQDFQLQWLLAALRAALLAGQIYHFQGIPPVVRNVTL